MAPTERMLFEPVPSTTLDLGSAAAPAADGCAEDPEPPSTRASRPRPAREPKAHVAALALLPLAPTAVPAEMSSVHLPGVGSFPPDILANEVVVSFSPLYAILTLLAGVLGSYGAIAAASMIGYSPTLLGQLLDDRRHKNADKLRQELAARDREYFVVAIILTGAGWVFGMLALREAVDPSTYPWALAVWTAMMLFGAGSLPGALADARSEATVLSLLPLLRTSWHVLRWPVVMPLYGTTKLAMRALRLQRVETGDPAELQKQVMAAVADNVDEDELVDSERTWIGNILALKDHQVSTVMTPRPDITALSENMTLREAVDQALEHEFSRYPVYRERLDEVIGIFYVKDALRMMQQSPEKLADTPISTLLREPMFVPETTSVAQLLNRVQAGNQHMAIVLDEYGTTVGLATIEDLVEEIVGEIEDEYDPQPDAQSDDQIRVVEAGRVLEIAARTSVVDINRLLGTQLSDDGDWDTVAGLVINSCNRIPTIGESIVVDDVEFEVLDADERRVQRMRATAITAHPAQGQR
ncbi:MAG: putative hemolysin [Planctomycetota bacterium]|jgi:putative hemolysin